MFEKRTSILLVAGLFLAALTGYFSLGSFLLASDNGRYADGFPRTTVPGIAYADGSISYSYDGKNWDLLVENTPVKPGLRLRSYSTGFAGLHLGNTHFVHVGSNTTLELRTLDETTNTVEVHLFLRLGEIRAQFDPGAYGSGKDLDYTIETPNAVVKVTGTDLSVGTDGNNTDVAVEEGRADVTSKKTGETESVDEGKGSRVPSDGEIAVDKAQKFMEGVKIHQAFGDKLSDALATEAGNAAIDAAFGGAITPEMGKIFAQVVESIDRTDGNLISPEKSEFTQKCKGAAYKQVRRVASYLNRSTSWRWLPRKIAGLFIGSGPSLFEVVNPAQFFVSKVKAKIKAKIRASLQGKKPVLYTESLSTQGCEISIKLLIDKENQQWFYQVDGECDCRKRSTVAAPKRKVWTLESFTYIARGNINIILNQDDEVVRFLPSAPLEKSLQANCDCTEDSQTPPDDGAEQAGGATGLPDKPEEPEESDETEEPDEQPEEYETIPRPELKQYTVSNPCPVCQPLKDELDELLRLTENLEDRWDERIDEKRKTRERVQELNEQSRSLKSTIDYLESRLAGEAGVGGESYDPSTNTTTRSYTQEDGTVKIEVIDESTGEVIEERTREREDLGDMKNRLEQKQQELDDVQSDIADAQQSIQDIEAQIDDISNEFSDVQRQIKELKKELRHCVRTKCNRQAKCEQLLEWFDRYYHTVANPDPSQIEHIRDQLIALRCYDFARIHEMEDLEVRLEDVVSTRGNNPFDPEDPTEGDANIVGGSGGSGSSSGSLQACTASTSGQYRVVDNHPDGGPNATGDVGFFDPVEISPVEGGCADEHLHGFHFGHADPAPAQCGHGVAERCP